jgi:hypothetical protein
LRYLFRGLIRETGKPVVGHVEADTEETAFNALADNGIVTESLNPDPKPSTPSPLAARPARYADALDSAFDASASQIAFDDLTERYRGKRVWVIDRDKIRKRVAQVVDVAISEAQQQFDNDTQTRDRVAKAIEGLFKDSKNITSPAPMPELPPPPQPQAIGAGATSPALESQVDRLANLITTAETVLAQIQAAARNASFGRGGGEGGGGRRRGKRERSVRMTDNDVLLEIFKSNMQLQRGVTPTAPAAPAVVAESTVADAGENPAPTGDEAPVDAVASSGDAEPVEDKA